MVPETNGRANRRALGVTAVGPLRNPDTLPRSAPEYEDLIGRFGFAVIEHAANDARAGGDAWHGFVDGRALREWRKTANGKGSKSENEAG